MQRLRASSAYQDLRTLLRAREIVVLLDAEGLGAAIKTMRAALVAEKSRRQYLHDILPGYVAYAIPGLTEAFVLECAAGQRFHLQGGTLPLLWKILKLEQEQGVEVIKVVHRDGYRQWTYCL